MRKAAVKINAQYDQMITIDDKRSRSLMLS